MRLSHNRTRVLTVTCKVQRSTASFWRDGVRREDGPKRAVFGSSRDHLREDNREKSPGVRCKLDVSDFPAQRSSAKDGSGYYFALRVW